MSNILTSLAISGTIGAELSQCSLGIVCLTPENVDSPWILFEAGAVGRSIQGSKVVPLLIDIDTDKLKGPLSQFQSVKLSKDGIRRIVLSLHEATESRLSLDEQSRVFDQMWPLLDDKLSQVTPPTPLSTASPREDITAVLTNLVDELRGLRIAPDERSIGCALTTLTNQLRGEVQFLESQRLPYTSDSPSAQSLESSIKDARARFSRLNRALQFVTSSGHALKAATVSVVNIEDIALAAERLITDLEIREYQLEARGSASSPYHRKIGEDWSKLQAVTKLLAELGVVATKDES